MTTKNISADRETLAAGYDGAVSSEQTTSFSADGDRLDEATNEGVSENHDTIKEADIFLKHYISLGSPEYEQANAERIVDGKIKVYKLGPSEHNVTLVAQVKVDPKTGRAISGHENRPEAESNRDIEKALMEYLATTPPGKQAVIYEGDEQVFADRDEAIKKRADSGLIQHLAANKDVPAFGVEPTEAQTVTAAEQLGITREELLASAVASGLENHLSGEEADFVAGYIHSEAARLGFEGFRIYSDEEKQTIKTQRKIEEVKAEFTEATKPLLPVLNELYWPALEGKDFFVVDENGQITINPELQSDNATAIVWDKLGWEGSTRLNEVNRLKMEMRDRVIFHNILEIYNSGKSPFVVYGGSHIVCLKPAINAYLQ